MYGCGLVRGGGGGGGGGRGEGAGGKMGGEGDPSRSYTGTLGRSCSYAVSAPADQDASQLN